MDAKLKKIQGLLETINWSITDYEDQKYIKLLCSNNHQVLYSREYILKLGKKIEKGMDEYECKQCISERQLKQTIDAIMKVYGWSFLRLDGSIIWCMCFNGHEVDYKLDWLKRCAAKKYDDVPEKCKKCKINVVEVDVGIDSEGKSLKHRRTIQIMQDLKWILCHYNEDNNMVLGECSNKHIIEMRYDSLLKLHKSDHVEKCSQCRPRSNKKTPEVMGEAMRNAGFDIQSLPNNIDESVSYKCVCGKMGSIMYKNLLSSKPRNNRCMSCAKLLTIKKAQENIDGLVVSVNYNSGYERSDVTIICSSCGDEYTCLYNNLLKSPDTSRCAECKQLDSLNTELKLRENIESLGFKWVGNYSEYKGRKHPLTILCKCGRTSNMCYANIKRGRLCMGCWNERKVETFKRLYVETGLIGDMINKGKENNRIKLGLSREEYWDRIMYKIFVSSMKIKEIVLPNGKTLECMGYEPQAINLLLRKIPENDIDTKCPLFKYNDDFNKIRVYRPDIIVKNKIIIEIKSTFTYTKSLVDNVIYHKTRTVYDNDYDIEVWVFDTFVNAQLKLVAIYRVEQGIYMAVNESLTGVKMNDLISKSYNFKVKKHIG